MTHKAKPNQPLLQEASSLLLVTALCGAGGALTTTANAAITATPGFSPGAPVVIPNNVDGLYINVVTGLTGTAGAGTAGWDINPYTSGGANLNFFTPGAATHGMTDLPGGSTGPGNLATGFIVDGTNTFISNVAVTFGASPGQWALDSSNYFGFRLVNESGGTTHFGWGRMIVGSTSGTRSIAELYYESTPATGIAVGAVPEPTSALLAAGAAGLLTLRRRRQAA
jgi:hypothetical protein